MSIVFGDYTPPKKETKKFELTLGVFFDGTDNNKNNTDAKELYGKWIKGEKLTDKEIVSARAYEKNGEKKPQSSYHNDWSNVARLWDCYPKLSSVYVDGIGTETEKSDALLGAGFGSGDTGIHGKVLEGCQKLAELVGNSKKITIDTLYIDVFGFSRGAAAARVFISQINEKGAHKPMTKWQYKRSCFGYYLQKKEITVRLIKIRFLGLFDTVSSYSQNVTLSPDFKNDLEDLKLNNIQSVKNVVHFTAMDEHRENFGLTNTNPDTEKMFPGVHSDIGGSYTDGVEIVKIIDSGSKDDMKTLSEKLINEFWYIKEQLQISTFFPHDLKGERKIKKTYSYIPLHLMAEWAISKDVPFDKILVENKKYTILNDATLIQVKARLHKYVFGNAKPYSYKWYGDIHKKYQGVQEDQKAYKDYQQELTEQKYLRMLRHQYLHWSADKGSIGMKPSPNRKRETY
ncbi:DUF2235 domain-containing protein [Flavobacterium sp. LS1R49]|uniref:DUF2235 domain-containing protein n=1 Tax=Flavobacterium shii TaxID=2987687 RepID=A0A9X3C733_9FLAO|nr:DUF2235 domain-containing protein [Flavobacterium shii]MCV9930582.1 DUF2235 domain-containing protein [Flavobacterium shii]